MGLMGVDISLTEKQKMIEWDAQLSQPESTPGIIPLDNGQRLKVAATGKKVKVVTNVWRREKDLSYTYLGYWLQEITDEPAPYFYKTLDEVEKAMQEKKLIPIC